MADHSGFSTRETSSRSEIADGGAPNANNHEHELAFQGEECNHESRPSSQTSEQANNTTLPNDKTSSDRALGNIAFDDRFHQVLNDVCALSGSLGWAVGILKEGDLICLSNGVSRTVRSKKLPVDELTLFKLGSCSESLTALLLNGMINQGYIDWNDPVAKYIPELAGGASDPVEVEKIEKRLTFGPSTKQEAEVEKSYWDCRTIRDLALNKCHRLPSTSAGFGLHAMHKLDQADLIRTIKYFGENKLPYSNPEMAQPTSTAFTYALIGLILDRAWSERNEQAADSDKRRSFWYESMTGTILEPRMDKGTTARPVEVQSTKNYVHSSHCLHSREKYKYVDDPFWKLDETDLFAPATGCWSNIDDMMALCHWILWSVRTRPDEMRRIFQPEREVEVDLLGGHGNVGLGLGWVVTSLSAVSSLAQAKSSTPAEAGSPTSRGHVEGTCTQAARASRLFQSRSFEYGHSACVTILPDEDIAVVALSNTGGRVVMADCATRLALEWCLGIGDPNEVLRSALNQREDARAWYAEHMLAPWREAKDLQSFFERFAPGDVENASLLVKEMVGTYSNSGLERRIVLSAHPWQMAHGTGRAPSAISLPNSVEASAKSPRQLDLLAEMCQLVMALDSDLGHQCVNLLPHHVDNLGNSLFRREWWSFLPTDEKQLCMTGCGHLQTPEESMVRVVRNGSGLVRKRPFSCLCSSKEVDELSLWLPHR